MTHHPSLKQEFEEKFEKEFRKKDRYGNGFILLGEKEGAYWGYIQGLKKGAEIAGKNAEETFNEFEPRDIQKLILQAVKELENG